MIYTACKNILLLGMALLVFPVTAQESIDLSGVWDVKLETNHELHEKYPDSQKLEGSIKLPGSLAEPGFGYKTTGSDYGILTPEYKYIGKATYSREIEILESWKEKEIEIFLERDYGNQGWWSMEI